MVPDTSRRYTMNLLAATAATKAEELTRQHSATYVAARRPNGRIRCQPRRGTPWSDVRKERRRDGGRCGLVRVGPHHHPPALGVCKDSVQNSQTALRYFKL